LTNDSSTDRLPVEALLVQLNLSRPPNTKTVTVLTRSNRDGKIFASRQKLSNSKSKSTSKLDISDQLDAELQPELKFQNKLRELEEHNQQILSTFRAIHNPESVRSKSIDRYKQMTMVRAKRKSRQRAAGVQSFLPDLGFRQKNSVNVTDLNSLETTRLPDQMFRDHRQSYSLLTTLARHPPKRRRAQLRTELQTTEDSKQSGQGQDSRVQLPSVHNHPPGKHAKLRSLNIT
jgi:hypothetical protein